MTTSSLTKSEVLAKMNARHGTEHTDLVMLLVWLDRAAKRCERGGPIYAASAAEYRADYTTALQADEDTVTRPVSLNDGEISRLVAAIEYHADGLQTQRDDPSQANIAKHLDGMCGDLAALRSKLDAALEPEPAIQARTDFVRAPTFTHAELMALFEHAGDGARDRRVARMRRDGGDGRGRGRRDCGGSRTGGQAAGGVSIMSNRSCCKYHASGGPESIACGADEYSGWGSTASGAKADFVRAPTFTHAELMALFDAVGQYVENHAETDPDEPSAVSPDAVSASEKLGAYVASLAEM